MFPVCVVYITIIFVKLFPRLLDDPSLLYKSTRHVHHNHELLEPDDKHFTTSSTILIRGLLDDFCFSDSDCTLTYSTCSKRTRRCMCKDGSHRIENGKFCILDAKNRKYNKEQMVFKVNLSATFT